MMGRAESFKSKSRFPSKGVGEMNEKFLETEGEKQPR